MPVDLGVLSRAAEFSLGSCVCSSRSDPAQQPAPGAPEGGAPEGGAPEGAAPGGGPPGAPPNLTSNRRLQQTQAQVQEVSSSASPEGRLGSSPTALQQQRCSDPCLALRGWLLLSCQSQKLINAEYSKIGWQTY